MLIDIGKLSRCFCTPINIISVQYFKTLKKIECTPLARSCNIVIVECGNSTAKPPDALPKSRYTIY